jgi:sterol desaturase/sphingolipid hydroxylase (fatty acid hydroxylase superfamily)
MSREVAVRVASFLAVSLAMAGWEFACARRPRIVSRSLRWPANLGILLLDTALVRLLFASLPLAIAVKAQEQGWGLLNAYHLPIWMKAAFGVILLDFVIYLQHVTFHAVPVLWRLHMMHHADLDFDFTTGGRFHPIEILLSMGIKTAAVAALGPPPLAFLLFEVLLNGTSMFNHGNVSLHPAVDGVLRFIVVTPDMHRVHHSVIRGETNSNFGFNLPWWDRIGGTYRDRPAAGHDGMTIGLVQFQEEKRQTLPWLLMLPFRKGGGGYPMDRSAGRGRGDKEHPDR